MKINDFIMKAQTKGYMPATVDQQNDKLKKDLEIKSYLGIKDKKKLIETIINDTIIYDNGLFKFNGVDQYISYTMRCVEAYTNLELSEDLEEDYDALCSSGLLPKILRTFEEEYQGVLSLLQMQCDYILVDNSVTAKLNSTLDNINKFVNKAAESIENIKPEDIQKIAELIKISR